MKKCYNCGAIVPDEAKFCAKCGKPLAITEELIGRAKANDQEAIAELYGRTYNHLMFKIQAKVPDPDTAEDLAQDIYIKAFKNLDQLNDPAAFPGWLDTIARNRIADWYKKYSKEKEHTEYSQDDYTEDGSAEDEIETIPEYRMSMVPEESMDREETTRLVGEILGTLPEGQRIVLVMYYYEQLSIKEIAEELDLNINTVKFRMSQGKKKVETKVLDLEKKGTKLYALAPLPFLLLLLHSLEDSAVEAEAAEIPAGLMASIREAVSASYVENTGDATQPEESPAGETPADGAASTSAQGTAKAVGSAAAKGVGMKAVVGIIIAAVVAGGAALAITKPWQDNGTSTAEAEEDTLEETKVIEEEEAATITTQEELYAAYASIVEEYEEEYGEGGYKDFDENDVYMTGTFLIELIDFNNDGWEELLVSAEDQNLYESDKHSDTFMSDIWVDIWSLVDGDVVKVYSPESPGILEGNPSNLAYGVVWSGEICYTEYNDGTICMVQFSEEYNSYSYELIDGEFVLTEAIDILYDEDSGTYKASYNGKISTDEDYSKQVSWHDGEAGYTDYLPMTSEENAEEMLSITKQTKITLGMVTSSSVTGRELNAEEEWRELYASTIKAIGEDKEGDFYLIYLDDDDVPELFYLASSFAESSSIYYILENRVIEQTMVNGWAGVEYEEYGGHLSATAYQMDAGVEEVFSWDGIYEMVQIFYGEFGYTGTQTDDPQYYLYDYGPVGYSYYTVLYDSVMTTVTEDQYLQEHSTKFYWRSDDNENVVSIYDCTPIATGAEAAIEYLENCN